MCCWRPWFIESLLSRQRWEAFRKSCRTVFPNIWCLQVMHKQWQIRWSRFFAIRSCEESSARPESDVSVKPSRPRGARNKSLSSTTKFSAGHDRGGNIPGSRLCLAAYIRLLSLSSRAHEKTVQAASSELRQESEGYTRSFGDVAVRLRH